MYVGLIKNRSTCSTSKYKNCSALAKMSRNGDKTDYADKLSEDPMEEESPVHSSNRSSSSSPLTQIVTATTLVSNHSENKLSNFLDSRSRFEQDKQSVYNHPMFPLLVYLLEKCELVTKSGDSQSSVSLHDELKSFLQRLQQDKTNLFGEDKETNDLMILAFQVLRIHLLELEKVQELSKDFCNRYICALKGKMQSENLVRNDLGGYDSDDSGSGYGGGSSIVSARPMSILSGIPTVTHLQYTPIQSDISGSGSGAFLMGPAPGSAPSWFMTSDPTIIYNQQQNHQQQLQQLQHLQHLRQQSCSDDQDRMAGTALSWEMLCKSTIGQLDSDHADDHGFDLFPDVSSRSSEKCVSKLSSLPSHYSNQHLVHHQLTDLVMTVHDRPTSNKPIANDGKIPTGTIETCTELLEDLSSSFHGDSKASTPARN